MLFAQAPLSALAPTAADRSPVPAVSLPSGHGAQEAVGYTCPGTEAADRLGLRNPVSTELLPACPRALPELPAAPTRLGVTSENV